MKYFSRSLGLKILSQILTASSLRNFYLTFSNFTMNKATLLYLQYLFRRAVLKIKMLKNGHHSSR